jgi:adenine-specific DNA-methyltransferase
MAPWACVGHQISMRQAVLRQPSTSKLIRSLVNPMRREIDALHGQCGIYTKSTVVGEILDAVGWKESLDLSSCRLLEPAAGDGAFVSEVVRRLVFSYKARGTGLTFRGLKDRIVAYEIHPSEARKARLNTVKTLCALGVRPGTSKALAYAWIKCQDFLLTEYASGTFTHAVGNPPYARWAKIPKKLKARYSQSLPRGMAGGDIFIPFLDRALEQLQLQGRCGFLCSDRWRFMQFAQSFRMKWVPQLEILSERSVLAANAYVEDVDAYPSILIARRILNENALAAPALRLRKTIKDFGFNISVGPALGHTAAFVLENGESEVEKELLHPWIDTSEVLDDRIIWRGRHVLAMHDDDGVLIDPKKFPLAMKRLRRFKPNLVKRSIVRNGAEWFRPIDRIRRAAWMRPKLLIPEIAKVPRIAMDRSGAIPSHGVYAVFGPDADATRGLYEQLAAGGLAKRLEGLAPKIKGGYIRCYKRFLEQVPLY